MKSVCLNKVEVTQPLSDFIQNRTLLGGPCFGSASKLSWLWCRYL